MVLLRDAGDAGDDDREDGKRRRMMIGDTYNSKEVISKDAGKDDSVMGTVLKEMKRYC